MAYESSHRMREKRYIEDKNYTAEEISDNASLHESGDSSVESDDPEWIEEVSDAGDLFYLGSTLQLTSLESHFTQTNPYADKNASGDALTVNTANVKTTKKKQNSRLKSLIKTKKTLKNGDLGPREVPGAEDSGGSFQLSKVTFQEARGLTIEIFLDVDPNRHNYGRRASLCEVLFGIIPAHFGSARNGNSSKDDSRIMVQGLIPDGEAMNSENVKIGDWLQSVNDVQVTFLNIHQMLSSITSPAKVKLTLKRFSAPCANEDLKGNQPQQKSKLAQLVSRHDHRQDRDPFLNNSQNCTVLYLTLEGVSELSSSKQDVVYQFPNCDNKLVQVRGMFVTLSHTLPDITASNPISSSLIIDEKIVHVGYAQEGKETFVLALPDECISLTQLHQLIKEVVILLRLQYLSLHEAFTQVENRCALDQMFAVTLQRYLSVQDASGGCKQANKLRLFDDALFAVPWLPLSSHIQMEIHNTLSDFEAADFVDLSDDYYDVQRTFTILGTCLFYRGYLLAHHLPREDMLDVFLYLKYHGLLMLTNSEAISRIVVWKEVFPTRRHSATSCSTEIVETSGRWFLMIVGLKQSLFAVLLEAGGCSVRAEGKPGPDPFYIDQAEATLAQLESLQIPEACETWLKFQVSSLVNVDWFMQTSKENKHDVTRSTSQQPKSGKKYPNELTSILKKSNSTSNQHLTGSNPALYDNESDTSHSLGMSGTSSMSDDTTPVMARKDRQSSNHSRTSGSDADSRTSSENNAYKTSKKIRTLPSSSTLDLNSLYKHLPDKVSSKLTKGCENILFHYLHLNSADGVFICPRECDSNSMLSNEVVDNFQAACSIIHEVFEKSLEHKEMAKNKETPRMGVDDIMADVKEHGILFQCSLPPRPNQKKPPLKLSYWVIGRLFEGVNQQEVYVCFLDSIPQNVVELAFTLGFGMTV